MPKTPVGPAPSGWYDDPYERGVQRFHDGTQWTDQTRGAPAPVVAPRRTDPPPVPATGPCPRPGWLRGLLTVAAVALVYGATLALLRVPVVGPILALLPMGSTIAFGGRHVGYRRIHIAGTFVPFYNLYLVSNIAWRLSGLPYRDWELPPDVTG